MDIDQEIAIDRANDKMERMEKALTLIAEFKDKTLIAPSLGPDGDRGHQMGAHAAFNQCAEIAADALSGGERT